MILNRAMWPLLAILALSANPYRMAVAYCKVACLEPPTQACRDRCPPKAPPIPRRQRRQE